MNCLTDAVALTDTNKATNAFATVNEETNEAAVTEAPIAFVVFRAILGFTSPERAYVTTEMTGVAGRQGFLFPNRTPATGVQVIRTRPSLSDGVQYVPL
jgi:hypothetical protein